MTKTLGEIIRDNADTLDAGQHLRYSGEVHTVELGDREYKVTIAVTRCGQLSFYEMYQQERDR